MKKLCILVCLVVSSCQYLDEWKGDIRHGCLLTQKDNLRLSYARNGQLTQAGPFVFDYNSKGKLVKIRLDVQNAYFTVVTDPRGNITATTLYMLDGGTYQDRGNSTSYYDSQGRLLRYESRTLLMGNVYWRFEYDSSGNVTKVFSRRSPIHGEQLNLLPTAYDTNRSPFYQHRLVRWLAATGLLQSNVYSNQFAYGIHNVTAHTFYSVITLNPVPMPRSHVYQYNANHYPVRETLNTGEVYTFDYHCLCAQNEVY